MIYLKIIGLFLSSFCYTTFIFHFYCTVLVHTAKKLSDYFFLKLVFRRYFPVFVSKRMEILLYFSFILSSEVNN